MSPLMQWLSLGAGVGILVYGVVKLFGEKDWVLFVLGLLIVAFTLSKMFRTGGVWGTSAERNKES
jgi:hypothetical protein